MTMRRQALCSPAPLATFFLLSLTSIFSFAQPSTVSLAEPVASDAAAPADAMRVTPGDVNTGALLLRSEDGSFVEAPRLQTDVVMSVNGTIARVAVTQRFENPSDRWLEGIYVFPLPEQSAVDALRMEIGDRVVEGEIKGRQDAKKAYEAAKAAGQKASLIEQERPNIFTNSVANIGPQEAIVVRIEYQETVKQEGGIYSLRFPLVVAPRYSRESNQAISVDFGGKPAPRDPVPDRDRIDPPVLDPAKSPKINPVTIQVKLNAGFVLGDVQSSYHRVALSRTGDETATLSLADENVPADKDFELTWSPKAAAVPQTALFRETVNGQDYLLAMVTPPTLEAQPKVLPRELVFVIDNSGSMETLFDTVVEANPENLGIAKHFVTRLDAQGGTEMLPALKAASNDATPEDASRLRQIVFLTDGAVGNEHQLFAEIAENLGRSRLFTVGIGSAPNSYFMARAAELGRGTFTRIGSDAQVLERMSALFAKLEKPVMIGLKADWPDGVTAETWPSSLPDLYAGEPVVLSAKIGAVSGELRLSGTFDGKPWTAALRLPDAVSGVGVGKLWARSKIAALETSVYAPLGRLNATRVEKEIEAVALQHHLASSQTSLVAIDKSKSRPDGQSVASVDMPVNLPEGWVYDKVFGPQGGVQRAMKATGRPIYNQALSYDPSGAGFQTSAMPSAPLAFDGEADMGSGVSQKTAPDTVAELAPAPTVPAAPQTDGDAAQTYPVLPLTVVPKPEAKPLATLKAPDDVNQRMAILALVLALLSAMTLIVWRHHRRDYASPRRIGRRI